MENKDLTPEIQLLLYTPIKRCMFPLPIFGFVFELELLIFLNCFRFSCLRIVGEGYLEILSGIWFKNINQSPPMISISSSQKDPGSPQSSRGG